MVLSYKICSKWLSKPDFILDLSKSLVVVARISERKSRSRSPSKKRRPNQVEREAQERIDRENRILLKKILEQHHGIRRSTSIPPPLSSSMTHHPRRQTRGNSEVRTIIHQPMNKKATSNQINQSRRKNKQDYENLLLLQKIQNAKPSRTIFKSFNQRKY